MESVTSTILMTTTMEFTISSNALTDVMEQIHSTTTMMVSSISMTGMTTTTVSSKDQSITMRLKHKDSIREMYLPIVLSFQPLFTHGRTLQSAHSILQTNTHSTTTTTVSPMKTAMVLEQDASMKTTTTTDELTSSHGLATTIRMASWITSTQTTTMTTLLTSMIHTLTMLQSQPAMPQPATSLIHRLYGTSSITEITPVVSTTSLGKLLV